MELKFAQNFKSLGGHEGPEIHEYFGQLPTGESMIVNTVRWIGNLFKFLILWRVHEGAEIHEYFEQLPTGESMIVNTVRWN